jgi:hypothetical protein
LRALDWQPIDSAPRDGTHILACDAQRSFGYMNGAELPPVQAVVHWWANPGEEGWYHSSVHLENPDEPPFPATHWKSLNGPSVYDALLAVTVALCSCTRPLAEVRRMASRAWRATGYAKPSSAEQVAGESSRDELNLPSSARGVGREEVARDARRYWRLRVLGCALAGTPQLASGRVSRFTNLDAAIDADIGAHPDRGEAELAALVTTPAAPASPLGEGLEDITQALDQAADHLHVLLTNAPDDIVADGGVTVHMAWRQTAQPLFTKLCRLKAALVTAPRDGEGGRSDLISAWTAFAPRERPRVTLWEAFQAGWNARAPAPLGEGVVEALRFYAEAWDVDGDQGYDHNDNVIEVVTVEPSDALLADKGNKARTILARLEGQEDHGSARASGSGEEVSPPAAQHSDGGDGFNGDNKALCGAIAALLEMDRAGALTPHGIGGHARTLLTAAAARLTSGEGAS